MYGSTKEEKAIHKRNAQQVRYFPLESKINRKMLQTSPRNSPSAPKEDQIALLSTFRRRAGELPIHPRVRRVYLQFRALIRSLVEASPDKCLTVQQLVLDLDINMSKGWVHFAKLSLPGK